MYVWYYYKFTCQIMYSLVKSKVNLEKKEIIIAAAIFKYFSKNLANKTPNFATFSFLKKKKSYLEVRIWLGLSFPFDCLN